jgi:hypothetical protein
VSNGHRLEDVLKYSMRRVQVLVDAINVRMKEMLRHNAIASRHAQGTDGKVFNDFLKSLESESWK